MFIRPIHIDKDGKRHAYWALVESYRTERGPRQRVVAHLGRMDERGRLGIREAVRGGGGEHRRELFDDAEPEWVEVDAAGIRVENVSEYGCYWLGMELVRREGLEVKLCPSPEGREVFILCRSQDRREKEKTMHERFEARIENGLKGIEASCRKRKYGAVTVAKRLGRLLGQNSRAAGLFKAEVKEDEEGRAQLIWEKVEAWREWADLSEGCYLLRSNVTEWSAEELWKAYIQLTEAEAAFRIQKSDLQIRPIWHQKEDRVQAHILVCFLAYVLWKMLGQLCLARGLGREPRRVLEELGKIKAVDVVMPTRHGIEIRRRYVTRPDEHQAILLQRLGFRLPSRLTKMQM